MVTSAEVLHLLLFCLICCLNSKDDSIKHDSDIVHTSLVHYITACVCAREPWYSLSNSLSYHFFNCASVAQRMLDSEWLAGSVPSPSLSWQGWVGPRKPAAAAAVLPGQIRAKPSQEQPPLIQSHTQKYCWCHCPTLQSLLPLHAHSASN